MLWRQLRAILIAPFTVTLIVPTLILVFGPALPDGVPAGWRAVAVLAGLASAGLGLWLIVWTIGLFVRVGEGTLAPFDPPRHLVVRGPYRHVRNPMISGVLFVLLGEAAGLLSVPLLIWFAAFCALNFTYIPLLEEPGLVRRFGDDYVEYRRHVPRWVPRVSGWPAE
ncbi:methyltransferase family protein [Amycolatopsis anabasis]|uniref:methyltransferase family protein n=1 Tax=Amycolatopsis anabasis TaxID=1840409 RepID=UPI00131BEAB9|nr:isoprenylcysteine carboxylmethyltransferase family protein [Amycolatopsis anabasis]